MASGVAAPSVPSDDARHAPPGPVATLPQLQDQPHGMTRASEHRPPVRIAETRQKKRADVRAGLGWSGDHRLVHDVTGRLTGVAVTDRTRSAAIAAGTVSPLVADLRRPPSDLRPQPLVPST